MHVCPGRVHAKVVALESSVSIQGRAIKLLQGGAAATIAAIKSSEQATEKAGHREVQDLEQKLDHKTASVAKQVQALDKQVRTLERENATQKAQLEAALLQQQAESGAV
jgi:hypothetical protein